MPLTLALPIMDGSGKRSHVSSGMKQGSIQDRACRNRSRMLFDSLTTGGISPLSPAVQFRDVTRQDLDAKHAFALGIDLPRQLPATQRKIVRSYVGFSTATSHWADFLFRVRYLGRRW
jgi:hypothetical protein